MTPIYTPEEAGRMKKRSDRLFRAACILVAAAFVLCVVFCLTVDTGNARSLLFMAIGIFTLAGWIAILLLSFGAFPMRAESRHMKTMLDEETVEYTGIAETGTNIIRIPRSVSIRKVYLTTEDGERVSLNVLNRQAALLPNDVPVRLRCAHKYITAFEVRDV